MTIICESTFGRLKIIKTNRRPVQPMKSYNIFIELQYIIDYTQNQQTLITLLVVVSEQFPPSRTSTVLVLTVLQVLY